jgi:calreticulin
MIENPNYKGEWVHPLVPNPDFVDDDSLYLFKDNKFVGIEVWQVKAGTIFDNFIVTDDVAEAERLAALTKATQEGEKKAFEKEEEERKAKEEADRKAKEAEEKANVDEEDDKKDEL